MRFLKPFITTIAVGLTGFFLVLIFSNMKLNLTIDSEQTDIAGNEIATLKTPLNTRDVAAQIAQILVASDPDGPSAVDGVNQIETLSPEKMVQTVLADRVEDSVSLILDVEIEKDRFNIFEEAGNSDRLFYLQKRGEIIRSAGEIIANQGIEFDEEAVTELWLLAKIYDQAINKLYAMAVPADMEFVHAEQIRLLVVQKRLFEAMANFEEDPLGASLAVSMWENVQSELVDLGQVLGDLTSTYEAAI